VPMLRPTIDAIAPTTNPDRVDTYSSTPGILWVRVFPGPDSTFTMFDTTELTQSKDATTVHLGYSDGTEFNQGAVFEVVGTGPKPASVSEGSTDLVEAADLASLEAATSGWTWDDASAVLFVKVPAGTHAVVATVPIT